MTVQIEKTSAIDEVDVDDPSTDETIPFEIPITWYGADFPVDGLVNRLNRNDIVIPDFQRGFVWNRQKSSRFIESLLLGLPVPGIFLSLEESQQHIVVDGQQRLKSLQFFYNGKFSGTNRKFALTGIESKFAGHTYNDLDPEDRRRLDNSLIHATIVRQNESSKDSSSIYLIFERLNTGGMLLQPQEIRAAIYTGKFNDLLGELNGNIHWRDMFGKVHHRMKDQELILRFLAMYFNRKEYKSPLTKFLNEYMGNNRHLEVQSGEEIRNTFEKTMELIHDNLGDKAFKPYNRFAAALFDSVAVGVANRLEQGEVRDGANLKAEYESLMQDEDFHETTFGGTAHTSVVERRLSMAIQAFCDIP